MDIAISRCNRLILLYDLLIHISASSSLMPVSSKISLHPQATTVTATTDHASTIQLAIDFYHSNRDTVTTVLHPRKNRSPSQTKKIGISIRRVAAMHRVPFSLLQCTIAAGGELKTRSEAHEVEMALTISEEAALEELSR